ncbi:DUF4336 domain-containing protein [Haliangium sp.]|uniref:DUF4336 domain-containing protein n=1 Tax=Haliangium sp. TaxID=2663208 RepID=UPI003D10A083
MEHLQRFGDRIWIADGPDVDFFGVPYPTRMVVAELEGGLWVWSPIELDAALEAEVRSLGEVKWIVSPNKIHHLFIAPWLTAFPDAQAFAPPGLEKRRKDLAFAGILGDTPEDAWSQDIDQVIVHGSPVMEEVIFFHRPSSTCIVGDLVQRHDPAGFNTWQRALMKLDGMVGEKGSTPREWRATFLSRSDGRRALDKALAWKPERLIIAHGACAAEGGAEVLETGLHWLTRPSPL